MSRQQSTLVQTVWATPSGDELVARMARVSAPENEGNTATAPRLIGYLIRHEHWSPFEMVSACLEITTTRDIARQLLRHRSFSFQEFSQRYASVDALPPAPLREARAQDKKNRQNSLPCTSHRTARLWREAQEEVRRASEAAYAWALEHGIAREVARAVLPEGLTSSRMYMAGTLRSWLHFCRLRRGNGTQKETQLIADAAWGELQQAFPAVCRAWEEACATR